MRFRVEYIHDKRKSTLILARRLDGGDFTLTEGAHLGPVAIHPEVSMPRALKPDGTPDLDVFVFRPRSRSGLVDIQVGDELLLRP
jgi:hypothetical protein